MSAMKDALQPFGRDPVVGKSCTAAITSALSTSQQLLMKLKLNPSGPGLFDPPQSHTASFTSSSEKLTTIFLLTSDGKDLTSTEPKCTPKSCVALNLFLKSDFASLLTTSGSLHH